MLSCPFLPTVSQVYRAGSPLRPDNLEDQYYYRQRYAQSCLNIKKPAQALLHLNHALAIDLPDSWFNQNPYPYKAIKWVVQHKSSGEEFLGNPVRHFQHLATRIPSHQPLAKLRSQRAWVCFHLSEAILSNNTFPRDEEQIIKENLEIPSLEEILNSSPLAERIHEITEIQSYINL